MLSARQWDEAVLDFLNLRDCGCDLADSAWITGYDPQVIETALEEIDAEASDE